METKTIIQTDKLSKIYGQGDAQVHALIDVDLWIMENDFVAIMGPSGSGKSTLMNILGCLDRPSSGSYLLAGDDVSSLDKNQLATIRNHRLGFIFQSFNLLAQTSALDNVMLPMMYNHSAGLSDNQQRQKAEQALNAVGLGSRVHHKPHELSGGQIQRVAIARALVNDPVLILADEPTGNLDTHSGEEIMVLLTELNRQGSTIVMVTHSDEIAAYAQRVIRFRDGRMESDHKNGHRHAGGDQNSSETVKYGNVTLEDTSIMGTTADFPSVRDIEIASGRYFSETDVERSSKVAVLGSTLAEELFGGASPIGQAVRIGNTKLTVIGVFKEEGSSGGSSYDSGLFTPITVVFEKFTPSFFARMMGDRVRMIYAEVEEGADMEEVILQIELLLAKRHGLTLEDDAYSVTTQQDIIQTRESTTASFRSLLAWVAAVSLVVGGIGIMNIMMVSVTERTREIGIRQSVGATPGDIRWQFLTEALLISLAGGLIGVIVGVGGAWLFGQLGSMRTVVVPGSILLAFVSSAAVGIFFGYYPANKAAQLDPIEALRHE